MAVKVYRSSDTNAPKLGGWAGAFADLLLACLVNGYGSVFATGTITSSGVNVSNNDTVTIDGRVFTFKTALTPAANEVLIGASAAASLTNLVAAINLQGVSGTNYGAGTLPPAGVYASAVTATVVTLTARRGGTTGNSLALAKTAATLTVSGATLSGGSGSDSTASSGWSNPFNGNPGQRVFRGGSGLQHYYHVDDASAAAALAREALFRGSETATGFQAATGYFPTVAQMALNAGLVARKSTTVDQTTRNWIIVADDRTVWFFLSSGDSAGVYMAGGFGEIYSIDVATDSFRSFCIGRAVVNDGTLATATDDFAGLAIPNGPTTYVGHYLARNVAGGGTAITFWKCSASAVLGVSASLAASGQVPFCGPFSGVEPATTAIIVAPVYAYENVALVLRGRMRGLFATPHAAATFGDGDTVTGAGAYAGRTFLVVKSCIGVGGGASLVLVDITGAWEAN
jgi:hypothetical protein